MYEFKEPEPVTLLDGTTKFPLCNYLMEHVLTLPYWHSMSKGALEEAEELLDQVEAVRDGTSKIYQLSKTTLDALRGQMAAVNTQNPNLVRPALRYGRIVDRAEKVDSKKEARDGTAGI